MTLTFDSANDNTARVILLDAADSTDPIGAPVRRDLFALNTIQIINAGGATVRIYAAVLWNSDSAAAEWQQIGSNITDSRIILLDLGVFPFIRVERDAVTSGTVTAAIQSSRLYVAQ